MKATWRVSGKWNPFSFFVISLCLHAAALLFVVRSVPVSSGEKGPGAITVFLNGTGISESTVTRRSTPEKVLQKRTGPEDRYPREMFLPFALNTVSFSEEITESVRNDALPGDPGEKGTIQDDVMATVDGAGIDTNNDAGQARGDAIPFQAVFGEGDGPRFLKREEPRYPLMARRLGKEGKVVLGLIIDGTGKLIEVEVVEPAGFGFTDAALKAVRGSTFVPAQKGGEGISSQSLLAVRFVLSAR